LYRNGQLQQQQQPTMKLKYLYREFCPAIRGPAKIRNKEANKKTPILIPFLYFIFFIDFIIHLLRMQAVGMKRARVLSCIFLGI
jgi:hypothetical protein